MTDDQPLCPRHPSTESRRIHDNAYICGLCGARLANELEFTARIAAESTVTIARLDRIGATTRRTDPAPPMPVNQQAADDYHAVLNTITTWARHVSEQRGFDLPPANRRPLSVAAGWLALHIDWVRHRPEAEEAFDELNYACQLMSRIVDRPPTRVVVGQCGCGQYLYALPRAVEVRCQACGTTYGVEASRAMLREALNQMIFTAAEIATLATTLGLTDRRDQARKLINVWSNRGQIVSHDYMGEPAYRFGEVIDKLVASRRAS